MTLEEWTAATDPNRLLEILSEAKHPIRQLAVEVIRLIDFPNDQIPIQVGFDTYVGVPHDLNIKHWFDGLLQPNCTNPLDDFKHVYEHSAALWSTRRRMEVCDEKVCQYIREVVNPFAPALSPDWLTDTVCLMVGTMLEHNEFSAMPILSDALEDSGCDDPQILNHCRQTGTPHRRNCWVLTLLRN